MRRARRTPQRYQLTKHTVAIVESGHPWVFRDQLSSAAAALADGQWLALYDTQNRVIGHGVYQADGAIAIRVLDREAVRPTAKTFEARIDAALKAREAMRATTDGFRAIHGESDGLPAVVVDVFAGVAVLQTYCAGVDALGRWAAAHVARKLGLRGVIAKPARRRTASPILAPRVLSGSVPTVATIVEDGRDYAVALGTGQKSGSFLDLRGLRRHLAAAPLAGARVLNLFAYTGTLGRACEQAGAAEIWNVDASQEALDFGRAHHVRDPDKHRWISADVFEWLPALGEQRFDLVIVDPPSMTSRMEQVPGVIAAYRRLYAKAREHVAPGGALIACCCTSRIERRKFRDTVATALGEHWTLERELPVEPDHPVGFPQADYLKLLIWRRTS